METRAVSISVPRLRTGGIAAKNPPSLDQAETAMEGWRRERGGGGHMCYPEARQRRRTLDGRVRSSVTAQVPVAYLGVGP